MQNPVQTIGIIGCGQLGRMISFYAQMMGLKTVIFADSKDSPASYATNQTIIGNYQDEAALQRFCELIDIATFEFENIPLECAKYVASKVSLYPKAEILETTQNRINEKEFLRLNGAATVDFVEIKNFEDLLTNLKKFNKGILKTSLMGYDGKGQAVIDSEETAKEIWQNFSGKQLILEKFCPFDSEISVIVARSKSGEVASYEPLTNIHKQGILQSSLYPAKISSRTAYNARQIAEKIAFDLDLVGILAVEFFVCGDDLLVNELAPRPHNSGHFSMNASFTSQFEQLIRAILGYKLGDCRFFCEGEMLNLIGSDILKIEQHLANSLAKIHLYGKNQATEGRKMGHINFLKPSFTRNC